MNTEMPCIPLVAEAETTATTSQSHSIVVQQSKNSEQQKSTYRLSEILIEDRAREKFKTPVTRQVIFRIAFPKDESTCPTR